MLHSTNDSIESKLSQTSVIIYTYYYTNLYLQSQSAVVPIIHCYFLISSNCFYNLDNTLSNMPLKYSVRKLSVHSHVHSLIFCIIFGRIETCVIYAFSRNYKSSSKLQKNFLKSCYTLGITCVTIYERQICFEK